MAGCFCLGGEAAAQDAAYSPTFLATVRRAADVIPGERPTSVGVLTPDVFIISIAFMVEGGSSERVPAGHPAFQVRFPRGWIMVDASIDREIAKGLTDSSLTTNRFLEHSANGVEVITAPGAYIIGGSLYAFGRIAHKPNVADLGWHGTEAVLLATTITGVLKGTLGRARPFVTNDTNPTDFKIGGGFGNGERQSFPSGHTTTAFAVASSVTSEIRRLHPSAVKFVAPVMYGGATMVGLSRMYHNKHWASDVVLGAAIGTFSGLKVVRYSHVHPHNKVDRIILGTTIALNEHGDAALGFTLPAP